ncbi:DUF1361 domain-containing protein [Nonlabens dokdonensis]|nr:DUF1361 domain-containing protein [Nonlabens dokdonensis]
MSILLLIVRLEVYYTFALVYLIWNLFLAFIPYLLVARLRFKKDITNFNIILSGIIWITFLPNAPYLLTDLIHIKTALKSWIVLESLMILSFSITGVYLGFISMYDMVTILIKKGWLKNKYWVAIFENGIWILCACGVYLGRHLRWNSWDLLHSPNKIFLDLFYLFKDVHKNQNAWIMVVSLSTFLIVIYALFKSFFSLPIVIYKRKV